MGPDRLDKFIKKQVEHHKTPTDPDLLWQQIQAKQNVEEKPKRRFLFFWLFGAALLIGGSLGYYYSNLNKTDDNKLVQTELNDNEIPDLPNQAQDKPLNEVEEISNDNTPADKSNEIKSNESSLTNTINNTSKQTTLKSNSSKNTSSKQEIVFNQSLDFTQQSKKKSNTDETIVIDLSKNQNEAKASSKQLNKKTAVFIPPVINQKELKTVENKNQNQNLPQNKTLVETPSNKNNITEPAFLKSELLHINSTDLLLEETGLALDFVEKQKPTYPTPAEYVDKNREEEKDKAWFLSTGAAFNYGVAPRSLSGSNQNEDYLQIRNDKETSLDAVRLGFDFRLQHKSGFYAKSGLEYEQINERFDYKITWDSSYLSPDQVVAIYYAMNGSSNEILGEAEVMEIFNIRKKIYNRYHNIDIPVLVGYASTKKKLGWFVEGGASMNVWFKARGEILSADDSPIRLEDNDNLFRTRTGLSLIGTFGLTYQLTEDFSVWASPGIKYHLGSITSDENLLDQKYLNVGLQVGIRYHISVNHNN